ncbi:Fimbria A protein precursor [Serratia ficaria]|uniref:fimbrial protein n=1 Tax=Serratia ficaria TaxID=61651 RepID=UPI002177A310|nr:fimbrial protein [Serratia ficaria]CAI1708344.1 Fimbria A protein precursor [Serratia ficaria]
MRKTWRFCLGMTALLLASIAQAEDQQGQVQVNGVIHEGACGIDSDSLEQTVDFGQLPLRRNDAERSGKIANGQKQFSIRLVNCEPLVARKRDFEILLQGTPSGYDARLLQAGGTAKGVAIELTTNSGRLIPLETWVSPDELMAEHGLLVFHAVLRGFGSRIGAGEINGMAQLTLRYF